MTGTPGHPPHTGPPGGRAPGPGAPADDEPAAPAAAEEADDGCAPEDPVETLRRERDEYLDMVRRVQADFENYKKRIVRQQTDHLERAGEDIVTKMLPVLDAFDLARAHLGVGDDLTEEGKALLAASALLTDTLGREGLDRIDDPGAPFDPTTHEAVDHVPDTDGPAGADGGSAPSNGGGAEGEAGGAGTSAAPSGPVVDGVLRAGYRWKGRIIRPAMVRVRG